VVLSSLEASLVGCKSGGRQICIRDRRCVLVYRDAAPPHQYVYMRIHMCIHACKQPSGRTLFNNNSSSIIERERERERESLSAAAAISAKINTWLFSLFRQTKQAAAAAAQNLNSDHESPKFNFGPPPSASLTRPFAYRARDTHASSSTTVTSESSRKYDSDISIQNLSKNVIHCACSVMIISKEL